MKPEEAKERVKDDMVSALDLIGEEGMSNEQIRDFVDGIIDRYEAYQSNEEEVPGGFG